MRCPSRKLVAVICLAVNVLLVSALNGAETPRSVATSRPVAATMSRPAEMELVLDLGKGVKLDLVFIPAGSFTMGGLKGQYPSALPGHEVTISKPFYLGKTEVTQAQYEAVMATNPSRDKGAQHPVETVSWDKAKEFCKRAGGLIDKAGRLPTEAEWEYACRAGSKSEYCNGDGIESLKKVGWFNEGTPDDQLKTHPVAQLEPNAWGLLDMHGNVFEWCADWFDDGYYAKSPTTDPVNLLETISPGRNSGQPVCRGGGAGSKAANCASAHRHMYSPLGKHTIGFRLLIEAGTAPEK